MDQPSKPKKKSAPKKPAGETGQKRVKSETNVAEDQRTRGYYYDDSHGYRRYVPDDEADTEEESA